MKPVFKIGLLIALLIAGGLGLMLSGVSPTLQPRRTPPPPSFEIANFQLLADLAGTKQITVARLGDLGDPSFYYFLPEQRVAYFSIGTSLYSSFYLFVNSHGDEIGRIDQTRVTFPMGNIFVDIDGYYTVSSDAVSPLIPYNEVNNRQPVPFETIKNLYNQSTLHRSVRYSDMDEGSPERDQKLFTHIMLIDDVWTRATTTAQEHLEWKTKPFPDFTTQYRFSRDDAVSSSQNTYGDSSFFGGKYSVKLTWFDEQEYFRRRAAPIGSPTGQGRPEHWRGTGYYTVTVGDASLGFSVPNDTLNLSGSGRQVMNVKGHETLDFIILQRYAGNKSDVYIFKSNRD